MIHNNIIDTKRQRMEILDIYEKFVRCRRRLKEDMEEAITVSDGKEFQIGMTRLAKKYFLVLCFVSGIESLRG